MALYIPEYVIYLHFWLTTNQNVIILPFMNTDSHTSPLSGSPANQARAGHPETGPTPGPCFDQAPAAKGLDRLLAAGDLVLSGPPRAFCDTTARGFAWRQKWRWLKLIWGPRP
jgi:hypothetical protein